MLQKKFYFSKLKFSRLSVINNSITESKSLLSFHRLNTNNDYLQDYFFKWYYFEKKQREVANCVWKDMIGVLKMWRHIRGYPQGGNTTYTNSKTSKKNKLLLNFRVLQFNISFGNKKRNIYPTLVKAEYTNRLWYLNWYGEWKQASFFAEKMAKTKKKGLFNPVLLAANQTNGYKREGAASRIGKAKKLTKVFTVGVPVFFSRFIFWEKLPQGFDHRLYLQEEVNKKLGKRFK